MKERKFIQKSKLTLITLIFVSTAILIFPSFSFGQNCSTVVDLLTDGTISSQKDAVGSTIDAVTISGGQFSVNYNLIAQPNPNTWPWVDVEAKPISGDFSKLCSVTITYKTTQNVRLVLSNPNLAGGTSHMYLLPISPNNWNTLTLSLSNFVQPDWVSPKTTIDLASVNLVQLTPIDYNTYGTIIIKELKLNMNSSNGNSCSMYSDILATGTVSSQKDALGSTIDAVTISGGQFSVNYNMVAQPNPNTWPWVDVEAKPTGADFKDLCSITLTYKTSQNVRIVLSNPNLAGGTSHMYLLPISANTWKTITIDTSQFKQPDWVSPKAKIDLANVNMVQFTPIDYNTTGIIAVSELKLNGFTTGITNQKTNSGKINIYNFDAKNIHILSTINEKCIMNIYSVDGKQIYNNIINLTEGVNLIALNSTLANGTYFIRLTGTNNVTVKKISLTK